MTAPTLRSIRFTDSRNGVLVGVRSVTVTLLPSQYWDEPLSLFTTLFATPCCIDTHTYTLSERRADNTKAPTNACLCVLLCALQDCNKWFVTSDSGESWTSADLPGVPPSACPPPPNPIPQPTTINPHPSTLDTMLQQEPA